MPELTDEERERQRARFERRVRKFSEQEILGLSRRQIYPPRALLSSELILPPRESLIASGTPVASMGSCFAREIKDHLEARGFNYLKVGDGPAMRHGSAPWERVYNTACIRQEIGRAFDAFVPDLETLPDGSVIDPHRKNTSFPDREAAARQCEADARAARQALTEARVFILTLGLSEVWYDVQSEKSFAEPPPAAMYDATRHRFRLLSPEKNTANLAVALELLRQHNSTVDVIVTVSPIPLRATFFDRSAVISNSVSKASLVWAAHQVAERYDWVRYFPSYEIVTALLDEPFDWDARHVTREAAGRIMVMFEEAYVA